MADELLVFEQTIEAVFVRALHGRVSPSCKARLRQAGLDLDRKLRPAYPFDAWMTFLRIAAEELYPREPLEQGAFKIGEACI
ncbi:MAG: TIGR02265 family protein, partial [Archangium sp.]